MRKEIDTICGRDELGYARIFQYEMYEGVEFKTGCGLVNTNNQEVVPCVYSNIIGFYNGSPLAPVERDNKWGYINKNLKEVTPLYYDFAYDRFHCGLAMVERNDKYGFIDKDGNEKIQCKYDDAHIFIDNLADVKKNNSWGIINTNEEIIVSFIYDYLSVMGKNRIFVRSNGKCGLMDYDGRSVVPCVYDGLGEILSNGKIEYKIGNEHGFMDLNGRNKEVLPF